MSLSAEEIEDIYAKCFLIMDKFAPEKIDNLQKAFDTAYLGREADLLRDLTLKYQEATPAIASSLLQEKAPPLWYSAPEAHHCALCTPGPQEKAIMARRIHVQSWRAYSPSQIALRASPPSC